MAIKMLVKRVFTISAIKESFLRLNANFIQYNMQYIACESALLAQETLFLTLEEKNTFFAQRFPKSA